MATRKMLLTVNPYSRPAKRLNKLKGVVIHWYANPNTSAKANRDFFEGRKNSKSTYGSAHYLVDPKEIIQALPDNEMGYHVGSNVYTASALRNLGSYPNNCTIGIEMAHIDWDGTPHPNTYKQTVTLAARILKENGLTEKNLWTHHQVVGWKDCHRWFTKNGTRWVQFVADVAKALHGKTIIITTPKPMTPNDMEYVEILDIGDKGDKVRELQTKLKSLGYNVEVDGAFGPATDAAVEKFQKDKKLAVDGAVGPKTAAALAKALADKQKPAPTKTKTYTVKKGDTLYGIATDNKITVDALKKANPKADVDALQIGMKLTIPAAKKAPAKKPAPTPSKPTAIRPYTRLYKYGMKDTDCKGTDIQAIQRAVNVKPDGVFGKGTETAVKKYQKDHKLTADGIVGRNTWNVMF